MKKNILFATVFFFVTILMVFSVSADVIFPTKTKVYFEFDGENFDQKVDFTVEGYGYSYPVGPPVEKEPGTYTPEVVYSFSATYKGYGSEIDENYYRNYRHIDYYEITVYIPGGETLKKTNIENIPTSCNYAEEDAFPIYVDGEYYRVNEEYTSCMEELENYTPTYGPASEEPVGAERVDRDGNIWVKQNVESWKVVENVPYGYEGLGWGNMMIDRQPGGITYKSSGYAKEECEKHLSEIVSEEEVESASLRNCEIRISFDRSEHYPHVDPIDVIGPDKEVEKKTFWNKVGCFFKNIFGKGC